jgi:hypothetical protein
MAKRCHKPLERMYPLSTQVFHLLQALTNTIHFLPYEYSPNKWRHKARKWTSMYAPVGTTQALQGTNIKQPRRKPSINRCITSRQLDGPKTTVERRPDGCQDRSLADQQIANILPPTRVPFPQSLTLTPWISHLLPSRLHRPEGTLGGAMNHDSIYSIRLPIHGDNSV